MKITCFIAAGLLLSAASAHAADGKDWHPKTTDDVSYPLIQVEGAVAWASKEKTAPTGIGIEGGLSAFWRPLDRDILVGPRVQLFKLFGAGRTDLMAGLETDIWLVNAFGLGLAVDYGLPLDGGDSRIRVESLLRIRLFRMGDYGAIAPRVAVGYDLTTGWAASFGLSWQLNGVL